MRSMRRRLSSYRFRRRLAWSAATVLVVGGSVFAAILVGNTGDTTTAPTTKGPDWVYREPQAHRLTHAERTELERMTSLFIHTAVARRDLHHAWRIVGPELRAGLSRRDWESGDNPVVPFPAQRITAWSLDYSYEGDVAFDVSLLSKPPYDTIGKTFMIELTRPPHTRRWLVSYWAPKGVSSVQMSRSARAAAAPVEPVVARLSARWLLVPSGFLAAALAGLAAFGLRSFLAGRRSARRYAAELSRPA